MNHDADLFETQFRTKLFPRIEGGLCYDSIPRNSRDKLTFYGIKKTQKPKGSKHTSRCVVTIKNPGIFRYFWSVLGRLIAHVYTLNLVLKLTGIKKEGVQQKSLSFIAGLVCRHGKEDTKQY